MPLPKVTRFVADGEVDPGVRDVALAVQGTFHNAGDIARATGLDPEFVAREIVKASWFVASRGAGIFTAEPFGRQSDALKTKDGISVKSVPLAATGDEAGGWSMSKVVNGAPALDLWVSWFVAAVLREPGRDTSLFSEARGNYSLEQIKSAVEQAKKNADIYRGKIASDPYVDLIVEAMMFFDPSLEEYKKVVEILDLGDQRKTLLYIARATASGVPILGRKWIVADMVFEGTPITVAKQTSYDVYNDGSNYFAWRKKRDRFLAIKSILVKIDPNVSDEEVQAFADMPIAIEEVERVYREKFKPPAAPSSIATKAATAIGAGALAAYAFGGPIGIAVGLGLLWLTRSKPEPEPDMNGSS
jgi:hypothetical protein